MIVRPAAMLAVTLSVAWAPGARALDIINDQPEAVRVIIENWEQVLYPNKSARFNPTADPVEIRAEFPAYLILCTAPRNAEVRFKDNACFVNGEKTAEARIQM
jgi:hypothetical protein